MKLMRVARIFTVGLFLTVLPLYGALYRSNSLGQQLQLLESEKDASSYQYLLQVSLSSDGVEERSLTQDGNEIKKIVIVYDPSDLGKKTVTETILSPAEVPSVVEKTFYEAGLPQRIERYQDDSEDKYITLHSYEDGQLVETKDLVNGELIRLTSYYRGSDGMLAGLRIVSLDETERTSYYSKVGQSTVFGETEQDNFSKVTFYPNNLVVRDVWSDKEVLVETEVSYDEAGRLVVEELSDSQTIQKTYGPDGMLVYLKSTAKDGSSRTVSYLYDADGVLDQSIEIIEGEESRRIEAWYRNGIVQTQTEWVDGQPVKASRFVEDGTSVVTLFEEGRPYVDITYAPDGKRVLSLEYRKER